VEVVSICFWLFLCAADRKHLARSTVFHEPGDFSAFVDLMAEASVRVPMRILAYCLMPNHFHLAMWPRVDGELSRWMHWLMTTHVSCYQRRYRCSGHIWQGRFKAFPIEEDEHLLAVMRYIERNPLRAKLVDRAEEWEWSSLRWLRTPGTALVRLDPGPVPRGTLWTDGVNAATADIDLENVRQSLHRDRPFGTQEWTFKTAKALNLEYSLRPPGRWGRKTT
jgi:putative transposase